METVKTDCLVIGAGLAGLTAAHEIAGRGFRTVIVYDGPGASPWVHGVSAPVVPPDSVEAFLEDTLKSGIVCDRRLAEALCADAPEIVRWIEDDLGLALNREDGAYQALRPLGASYARVVSVGNETGAAIMKKLRGGLEGRAELMPGCRALELVTRDGRAAGARVWNGKRGVWFTVLARAVLLAGGGFCGMYSRTTNKRDSGADMAAMAYAAGAKLRDMEFVQFEPSGAVWPPELRGTSMITTLLHEGAVLRNSAGERFMDEQAPKDVMARRIAEEILAGKGTPHGGVWFDACGVGRERLDTAYPMYVERYRAVGIDLAKEMIELAPVAHTSLGGAVIDTSCLTTVPMLYACGEAAGGIHGANRIGGSAGLETLVFGRRAGMAIARALADDAAPERDIPRVPERAEEERGAASEEIAEKRRRLGEIMTRAAGVLRNAAALKAAVSELAGLMPENAAAWDEIRLKNDLTVAGLVMRSALKRGASMGCHVRTDGDPADDGKYIVTVRKTREGECAVDKEALNG